MDAGGHLLAFQRQDCASTGRIQQPQCKAADALFLGMSSRKIGDLAAERPTFLAPLCPIAPAGVVPAAGVVIIVDASGMTIGAVGISGDLSDKAEACTLAGIVGAGLTAQG